MTRVPRPADHIRPWQATPEADLYDLHVLYPQYRIKIEAGSWSAQYVHESQEMPVMTAGSAFALRQQLRDDWHERRLNEPNAHC